MNITKEQIIAKFVEQGKDENELNSLWNDFTKDAEDFVSTEEIPKYCLGRFTSYYLKDTLAKGEKFEGVFIGFRVHDYGKTKKFEAAKKSFLENPKQTVEMGITDNEGNPLEQKGFAKGKKIDINNIFVKDCIGVTRKDGTENFEICQFELSGAKLQLDLPLFTLVDFVATVRKSDTGLKLGTSKKTTIVEKQDMTKEMIDSLLQEHFKNNIISFDQMDEFATANEKDWNNFAIIRGDVVQVTITDGSKSNVLTLNEQANLETTKLDDMKTLTCWVGKELPLNISESAQDVLVIGRLSRNKKNELSMNTIGYYCPEQYRKPENIQTVEEIVEATPPTPQNDEGWIQ